MYIYLLFITILQAVPKSYKFLSDLIMSITFLFTNNSSLYQQSIYIYIYILLKAEVQCLILLRSRCATSTTMSSQSFFFLNFYFTYNFFKNFTNFRLINPSPIINLYNKSQSTLYLFTSTIKPSPRHFQLKGKI